MAALSTAALRALQTLADDEQAVVITVQRSTTKEWWSARVQGQSSRFTIRVATFHKLRHSGLIVQAHEWQEFGLLYTEYVLTDAGRAALESV